jgi:hypothetical protein
MKTIFFRLLRGDNKAATLCDTIEDLHDGSTNADTYTVVTSSFAGVPGSPLAYWLSDSVRTSFSTFPALEALGRALRQGTATADDFRFVRLWWEPVAQGRPSSKADKGASGDTKTAQQRGWQTFAKGGVFSPYYDDPHLLINWDCNGAGVKSYVVQRYPYLDGKWEWVVKNAGYYFRPGLTWPRRTISGLSVRVMPSGCVFADKGPAIFVPENDPIALFALLGLTNSVPYRTLLFLLVPSSSFEVGLMQVMPVPDLGNAPGRAVANLAREAHNLKRDADRDNEVPHPFNVPALVRLRDHGTVAKAIASLSYEYAAREKRLVKLQHEIDNCCFDLYGFTPEDRAQIEREDSTVPGKNPSADEADEDSTNGSSSDTQYMATSETANLVLYAVGCVFGRWDIRIGRDPSLAPQLADPFAPLPVCAPGALVSPDGLPAAPGGIVNEEWLRARPDAITLPPAGSVRQPTISDDKYPIRIAWDGILVDDPEHPADIVRRVREVLAALWPGENGARAEAIEREACAILGVRELREYFRRPAGFFEDHLKRYSKSRRQAPIYWPLSTASGSYTLWVYYHRLTSDTLYTAVNRYVEPKIAEVQRRVAEDERQLEHTSGREASGLRMSVEQGRALVRELQNFREELLRVAALPYRPDLNDGVIITASPLHQLFRLPRWAKDTKACWEKLEHGDYDWAHLAYTLWPDRVRAKCRTDKSLAIAHGLEELYVEPPASAKKARGRKASAAQAEELLGEEEDGEE